MTSPTFFDVTYVINPHMSGNIGTVDREGAQRQWISLRDTYKSLGFSVHAVEGAEGLVDMVFCANQTLPYYRPESGVLGIVSSRMHAPQRREEVTHFERFFRERGYEITPLPPNVADFEGMGDAIWHPGRYLLWGGYGIRSSLEAYESISTSLNASVIPLLLEDDEFYHLDTCFCVLDERSVLLYPGAFRQADLEVIRRAFDHVLEAPEEEARRNFACNAHCPDGRNVLIQEGCFYTNRMLREAGFTPLELDTSEFIKAGGSVFCMKQMFW
jgi:N-dimethylarginine dimethylaminohydrolase